MSSRRRLFVLLPLLLLSLDLEVRSQPLPDNEEELAPVTIPDFELSWFTIDGGGGMSSLGGDFEVSATIAQPDAAVMTGGNFELKGGFWAISQRSEPCGIFCDGFESGDCSKWSSCP